MPLTIIEVYLNNTMHDTRGTAILHDAPDIGITTLSAVHVMERYFIEGEINTTDITRIGRELLCDPLTQEFRFAQDEEHLTLPPELLPCWSISVQYHGDVTDTVGKTTERGIKDLGITTVHMVRTGYRYILQGALTAPEARNITTRLLANAVIEDSTIKELH